jgi:1-acyl-sn-glycerol-3-phosphate acyltransferase
MTLMTPPQSGPSGSAPKDVEGRAFSGERRTATGKRRVPTSSDAPTAHAEPPSAEHAHAERVEHPAEELRLPSRGTRERRALDAIVKVVERLYGEEISRRIRALKMQQNEAGFDPFGFDPDVARYVLALVTFLHRTYFRTEVFGIDRVPTGRALFVANHSGHIPIDGVLIAAALIMDREPPILARAMVEKWAQRLPFVSVLFTRVGQVLGSPDNARRLLQAEHPLLVFPEGINGISKPFADRYKLANFGPGFMRLALETNTPIIPIAVVGGEEQYPAVGNIRSLAKLLKMPVFPVIPQVLMGVPLPLPTKYRLHFGEPMYFEGDPDEDDADIATRVDCVRESIQGMLGRALSSREHVFW